MNRDAEGRGRSIEIAGQHRGSPRRSSRSTTAASPCSQVAELRAKLREADATFTVVKNSLTERAADKAGAEALKALLAGPDRADVRARRRGRWRPRRSRDARARPQVLAFKGGLMDGAGARRRRDQRDLAAAVARGALRRSSSASSPRRSPASSRTLNALIGGLAVAARPDPRPGSRRRGERRAGGRAEAAAGRGRAEAPLRPRRPRGRGGAGASRGTEAPRRGGPPRRPTPSQTEPSRADH